MKLKSLFAAASLSLALFASGAVAQAPAATAPKATTAKPAADAVQKPPSPGMVWANTKSKIYHKEGDQWYGKGSNSKWMTEADAKKAGFRAPKENATAKPKAASK